MTSPPSHHRLRLRPPPPKVNVEVQRPQSDEEFERLFCCSRDDFAKLNAWKQRQLARAAGLERFSAAELSEELPTPAPGPATPPSEERSQLSDERAAKLQSFMMAGAVAPDGSSLPDEIATELFPGVTTSTPLSKEERLRLFRQELARHTKESVSTASTDSARNTLLHHAVFKAHTSLGLEFAEAILDESTMGIERPNADKYTPMILATFASHMPAVQLLLSRGARMPPRGTIHERWVLNRLDEATPEGQERRRLEEERRLAERERAQRRRQEEEAEKLRRKQLCRTNPHEFVFSEAYAETYAEYKDGGAYVCTNCGERASVWAYYAWQQAGQPTIDWSTVPGPNGLRQ
jgi:hypothetical protein